MTKKEARKHRFAVQRLELETYPDRILSLFHKCYKKEMQPNFPKGVGPCWVWTKETRHGDLALLAGQPRFGPGKLAPPPANSLYAKRYIYAVHYEITNPIHIPKRIRMMPQCHQHCVNPRHMARMTKRMMEQQDAW